MGIPSDHGDLVFRFFTIPAERSAREKRVEKIRKHGSDRTDQNFKSRYDSIYEEAASIARVHPLYVIDCMLSSDFFRRIEEDCLKDEVRMRGNGLLVYEKRTEKGLILIKDLEYTFTDLSRRNEALLAILNLK